MTPPPAFAGARRARRPLIEELIDAARAGDRTTFDRLFDLWFEAVLADAQRSLGDRAGAQELTGTLLRRTLAARLLAPLPDGGPSVETASRPRTRGEHRPGREQA